MRALYTAASGLQAQQTKLDLIGNNVANVNTTGYKTKDVEFADLLRSNFEQTDKAPTEAEGRKSDPGLRIGNGVKDAYLMQTFTQGNIQMTGNALDLAIEGDGFLTVGVPDPGNPGGYNTLFTRAGKFQTDANGMIVSDGGYPLLDYNQQPIKIDQSLQGRPITIQGNGDVVVQDESGPVTVGSINLVLVRNPEANLKEVGDNLYQNVNQAYKPLEDSLIYLTDPGDLNRVGAIRQGALEMSNVDMPKEMSDLIQVQRAYQLNARSLQTIDSMMGMANNLRA